MEPQQLGRLWQRQQRLLGQQSQLELQRMHLRMWCGAAAVVCIHAHARVSGTRQGSARPLHGTGARRVRTRCSLESLTDV
jgi:hypothetical protein